jgi:hypothetical protein
MKAVGIALVILIASSSCAVAATPLRVEAIDLPEMAASLIGRTVVTQGCLADTNHGAYIAACGEVSTLGVVPVTDPNNLIPGVFVKELGHLRGELEVEVVGQLKQDGGPTRGSAQEVYLELHTIVVPGNEP